jgi:hypothetical protein
VSEAAEEALRRARAHLRDATLSALEATRALLEAAAHGSGLAGEVRDGWLGELRRSLDEGIAAMRANPGALLPRALTEPLQAALDAEIARWERRSRSDPDARLVLRAFLGLRELLWEIGVGRDRPPPRTSDTGPSPRPRSSATRTRRATSRARPRRGRVQRFDVEGP